MGGHGDVAPGKQPGGLSTTLLSLRLELEHSPGAL